MVASRRRSRSQRRERSESCWLISWLIEGDLSKIPVVSPVPSYGVHLRGSNIPRVAVAGPCQNTPIAVEIFPRVGGRTIPKPHQLRLKFFFGGWPNHTNTHQLRLKFFFVLGHKNQPADTKDTNPKHQKTVTAVTLLLLLVCFVVLAFWVWVCRGPLYT